MLRLPGHVRFSLGELLFVALIAALGLAALKMGGLFAAAYVLAAAAFFAGLIVAATIGRGVLQAFAIGALVGSAVYGGVLYWHGDREFEPGRGELLTTRAATPIYSAMRETYYVDVYSEREATAEETDAASRRPLVPMSYWQPALADVPLGSTVVAHVGNTYWKPGERPESREFMRVFHLLAALTLGYATGKFGAALYRRRMASSTANQEEPEPSSRTPSSPAPAGGTGFRQ